MRLKSDIDEGMYRKLKEQYGEELVNLKAKKESLADISPQKVENFLLLLKNLRNVAKWYLRLPVFEQRIVLQTLSSNMVLDGKKLEITIKSPFVEWTFFSGGAPHSRTEPCLYSGKKPKAHPYDIQVPYLCQLRGKL